MTISSVINALRFMQTPGGGAQVCASWDDTYQPIRDCRDLVSVICITDIVGDKLRRPCAKSPAYHEKAPPVAITIEWIEHLISSEEDTLREIGYSRTMGGDARELLIGFGAIILFGIALVVWPSFAEFIGRFAFSYLKDLFSLLRGLIF